jgi:hypothetical protein
MRDTQRQALSDGDYFGVGAAAATGASHVSSSSADAMTTRLDKEMLAMDGRVPTLTGAKAGANVGALGDGAGLDPQRASTQYDTGEYSLSRAAPGEAHDAGTSALGNVTQDRQFYGEDGGGRFTEDVQGSHTQRLDNPYAMRPLSDPQ